MSGILPKETHICRNLKKSFLFGPGYVYEEILGIKFRISASSFFQVNTKAAELLYSKSRDWASENVPKNTILLDLCCGTGTIGQVMASHFDRVVGIDIVEAAIRDAQENAQRNGTVPTFTEIK
jgi:tRNA (uracil-5-)-methyltransferase